MNAQGLGAAAPGEGVGGNVTQSENFAFIVVEGETSLFKIKLRRLLIISLFFVKIKIE